MSRALAVSLVGAFACSLLTVLVVPFCARDREPDPSAFVRALQDSRARVLLRPGDILLVHPPWREDVVRAIERSRVLPERARVTAALAPRHGDPLPALVVLTDGGMPLPRVLADSIDNETRVTVGGIRMFRVASAARKDKFTRDLTSELAEARVTVRTRGGETVPCPWDAIAQRSTCPGLPEWMYVGVEKLLVEGKEERCVWAHPTTGGAVSIHWERPPLLRQVTLDVALADAAADNRAGAPVDVELRIDGDTAGVVTAIPGRRGFRTATFPVLNPSGSLELVVTSADDGQRHTCFRLSTQDAP